MSFDFLACAGPEPAMREIEKRSASGDGMTIRVSRPGFRLWAPPTTPVLTSMDGTTTAIGLVIDKASGRRLSALWPGVNLDADFAGRHWGAYALVQVGVGGGLNLLREPSGTIPVFRVQRGPLALAASGPEPMLAAGMPRWTPDLHFLRHWLCFPFLRTARTGVEAVRELLPGTAVHGSGEPNTIWSPWAHAKQGAAPSWEEATAALRDALLYCVPALVPDQGKIVLQLSGGLDSSIIAAALAQAGHSFTAVTFATRAADGDERAYARDVAGRLGVELIELVEEESAPDFSRPSPPSFRPPSTALLRSYRRLVGDQLGAMGADWVVNGAGGDNIFASLNSAGPVLDGLRVGGIRTAATAAADLAAIHNATRWHVLRLAARKARRRRPLAWSRELRFLDPAAMLSDIDPHPWLPPPVDVLPGKSEHVRSLIGIQHFLDADEAGPNGLFPLLAQPLLELCLSIPTHLWVAGGRDRAVARAAMRGLLPDRVLDRRGKGRLESLFIKGYMQGRSQLEELLLDGRLRAHGIIDVDAVRSYLREPHQPRDVGYTRLLELAAAEAWLRSFGP